MATIDTLCILVALERIETVNGPREIIVRAVRTYECRSRADEDMELLQSISPGARFRIDDVIHIDR